MSPPTRQNPTPQLHTITWLEWSFMVSLGTLLSQGPHPNAATARDNAPSIAAQKYRVAIMRSSRLYSSAVQHRGATVRLFNPRCSHDDHIFPRARDGLRIHAADGF